MHVPPPPSPNLEPVPVAAEVRTADEEVLRWLDRKDVQGEIPYAADVARKFDDAGAALAEDRERQRELRKERDEAVKAGQQNPGERETRRRPRAERRR